MYKPFAKGRCGVDGISVPVAGFPLQIRYQLLCVIAVV